MAEACRLGDHNSERKSNANQDENFCILNVFCVFISLVTILADLTTDILVFAEYCKDGYTYWALGTVIFILTPNILINIFSMRWFVIDKKSSIQHWITHGCLVGLLERYILFLSKVFLGKSVESIKIQKIFSQINDLSLLHFLYVFTGTVPQIILQSYAIVTLDENYHTKAFGLIASTASVIWSCATYIYSTLAFTSEKFSWISLVINLIWHFGVLIGRITGILLFTTIFGIWMLVPLGLHWFTMTFWIVTQKTTFCPNKLEETLYNVVMGFVYCFCYINLREGHTRYRLLVFYTLMVTQNFGSLFLYVLITDIEQQKKPWSITATVSVVAGTVIGMMAMILYYRCFHSKAPILWKDNHNDIELNNKTKIQLSTTKNNEGLNHVRSFKTVKKIETTDECSKKNTIAETVPQSDIDSADKKFLLDHWIARSGTPTFTSAPVGNSSMDVSSIEFHTVENTPQTVYNVQDIDSVGNKINSKSRKKMIFSPTELTLKLSTLDNTESSGHDLNSINKMLQKRRGICSSDELREGMTNLILERFMNSIKPEQGSVISHETDGSNKKTSSDSIDMDLDLSFSDINSSDINTFNENIVQKLCLSALKNIKVGNQDADIENIQRIALEILKEMYAKKGKSKDGNKNELIPQKQRDLDTPTEVLSVHDYENICAVNIAREAWGLRSWNGYCDIENMCHDGSVVRERRCDTFTSGSSEISSCMSQELKNTISTAPPFPRKTPTYSNVFVRFDRSNLEDYVDTVLSQSNDETFLAKPCLIDTCKDPSQLEPILEELDDLGDVDQPSKKMLTCKSSLVATIDEISKLTVTNSPRNVYHRREHQFDSPQFHNPTTIDPNLKNALWKEPYKFDSSNIMETLSEKENILNESHGSKFEINKKGLNETFVTPTTDIPDISSSHKQNIGRRHKNYTPHSNMQNKRSNIKSEEHLQDLSNKNIDLLWQLVSANSLSNSTESLSSNRISSSLQSLIQKDLPTQLANTSISKTTNVKKEAKNRPRRKFSILRERFEPRIGNSNEESLYRRFDNTSQQPVTNFVNVKNNFDLVNEHVTDIPQKQKKLSVDVASNNANSNESSMSKNIGEKRSLFMKQVLSPPKLNTKLRYKL